MLKQIEVRENCKILFRGSSAKEIFSSGADPATDLRFHAVIMCDTPGQAVGIKKAVRELIAQVEAGVDEGVIPRPPVVEGFSFVEKVQDLADNMYQYDFLNANGGAPLEVDLKDHFEHIGDLRHWLHQRGIEVELGDDSCVKLPSTSRVAQVMDKPDTVDNSTVEIFNAFFDLVTFWVNAPPAVGGQYWFEPFELQPVGLLGLTEGGANVFESGQVVKLSEAGVAHFARLITQGGFLLDQASTIVDVARVIRSFKGVVRTSAKDSRLLMYLKYPWALSSSTGTVARDVPEEFKDVDAFKSVLHPMALRECGRMGYADAGIELFKSDAESVRKQFSDDENLDVGSLVPGESLLRRLSLESVPEGELPYVGYIVDWVTPKEVTDFVSGMTALPAVSDEALMDTEDHVPATDAMDIADETAEDVVVREDLNDLSVVQLRDRLKMKGLSTTGRKADLIERIEADERPAGTPIPDAPKSPEPRLFKCRVELPKALMKWSEMTNNLTGPGNSHFNHIKQLCPSANITCLGSASAALVGEARLHVQLTATDAVEYKKAKSLVEDLVKAVAEVGADICLSDESAIVRAGALKEVKVVGIVEP